MQRGSRDLGRIVLAVRIEGDNGDRTAARGRAEPVRIAAPLPAFGLAKDIAPAASAWAAVSSVEPSSTTTTGRDGRGARTTAAIRGPSWYRDQREDGLHALSGGRLAARVGPVVASCSASGAMTRRHRSCAA